MSDLIDWVEKAATENLRSHLQNADQLAAQANTTLTVLLTAAGAATAYVVKTLDSGITSASAVAAASLALYFFILCSALILKCMKIGSFPSITNEPKNILQDGFPLEAIRRVELKNIQERIEQARERNYQTAQWLNNIRIAAIFSPVWATLLTLLADWAHLF